MSVLNSLHYNLRHGHLLQSALLYYSDSWHLAGYALAAIGIFLEGDAVLFTTGFLTHQGFFNPWLAFFWLLAGSTLGDILWYQLGVWLEPKNNWLVRWLKRITNPLGRHLLEHPKRSLFLSKFLYGVNHAILAKAGALGLPMREFIRDDLPGNIAWILIVGSLGYASSAGVVHFGYSVHVAELGLLLGILLFVLISRTFSHFFRKKL